MVEHNDVTTGEVMEFLKDHMVMREDLTLELSKQKTDILQELSKQKTDILQELSKQKTDILDGIDEKLADLKGDLVILMRKEDRKVISLIGLLQEKRVISADEAKSLLGMEPFPQLFST